MATLLTTFTVAASTHMYIDMYAQPFEKLKLLFDITTTSTIVGVDMRNGYGGPSDPSIPYPWNQPVPLSLQGTTRPTSTPIWSSDYAQYTPTPLVSNHQVIEVIVDRSLGTAWLEAVVNIGTAQATVNLYGEAI